MSETSGKSRKSTFVVVLLLLVLLGGGLAYWKFGRPVKVDPDKAIALNNRGIGLMEQFNYADAAAAFEEAVKHDPTWQTAKINLAIALLNWEPPEHHPRVEQIFADILKAEPDNPYANYSLGILWSYRNDMDKAFPFFEKMVQIDPKDAFSWYLKGVCDPEGKDSPRAIASARKALELNPYLNAARDLLNNAIRNLDERRALIQEFQALRHELSDDVYDLRYSVMGKYASVIGAPPPSKDDPKVGPVPPFAPMDGFQVTLAPGARWATAADDPPGPDGELRKLLRTRYGQALSLFDYNNDGKVDILILRGAVENGQVRDLLLKNEGSGAFRDVTKDAGLDGPSVSIGCTVADFDHDGYRDLAITGIGKQRLLRNTPAGRFEDISAKAGLDTLGSVCLGAAWADFDQDSDSDLLIARLAATTEGAIAALKGQPSTEGGLVLFLNAGDSEPVPKGVPQNPLQIRFKRAAQLPELLKEQPVGTFAIGDLDHDKDLDVLVFPEGKSPRFVGNQRLLRFQTIDGFPGESAGTNGALVIDVNNDGRSDLLLLNAKAKPTLLIAKPGYIADLPPSGWYETGSTNSPPLSHGRVVDVDGDGWFDVVARGSNGEAVLLHNDGKGKLVHLPEALGTLPKDLLAVTMADLNGRCASDLVVWSEKEGLIVRSAGSNGNQRLRFDLSGRNEKETTRSNGDGLGCKVTVQTGKLVTTFENVAFDSGLGQSRSPIEVGLGRADAADVIRLTWLDGVPQAELQVPACEYRLIKEESRKATSCPVLFVWDGTHYRYVTDFLGGGALGESGPDGAIRPARPQESVKIEPGLLVPKDGKLSIKIAEPMDETLYLDRVRLVAIDHPAGTQIHPDERFVVEGSPPTQNRLGFKTVLRPTRGVDHRGRDILPNLIARDGNYVDGFHRKTWLGYAETHFVELDFDSIPGKGPLFLILAGWTDYAYPESIYAATQAGYPTIVPRLEKKMPDGTWKDLGELGFPAGLPKVMTRDVADLLDGSKCTLRIRTNLNVYWDEITLGRVEDLGATETTLDVASASLVKRGFAHERRPTQIGLVEYDDRQSDKVSVTPWRGMFTRLGDVTELLKQEDDTFVVCGPGDEIRIDFDAAKLPPVKAGWIRSFVLKTDGYCKDTSPTTVSGGRVEPLPFRGMKTYPAFDEADRTKSREIHDEYRHRWNTRPGPGGR
jgi:tetratricopeptide (TPR) repeat protein